MTYDPVSHSRSLLVQRCVFAGIALFIGVFSGHAQISPEGPDHPAPVDSAHTDPEPVKASDSFIGRLQAFDRHLFRQIYAVDNPAFQSFVYISDATTYRTFYGSVPAALVYSSADGNGDWSDVYRLALSELLTLGASEEIKKAMRRDRPPYELAGTGVRIRSDDGDVVDDKSYSFPSGHAAIAATLVTSWSLSYPEWYVIAPGVVWVSSVAVSRIWRGRHFPGDTVGGILLGAAIATTVHLLDPLITPGFLKADESASNSPPRFAVVIPIQ